VCAPQGVSGDACVCGYGLNMAAQRPVSRGVRAGEQHVKHELSRKWLGKREWHDIRRACTLSASGSLYAAEIHGVKLLFRWERPHASPVESNGEERSSTTERRSHARPARAQVEAKPAAREPNSRKRRSALRLQVFMRSKGAHEGTTAAPAPAGSPPQASTSRPESGVRAPAAVGPEQRRPKAVEIDSLKAADHAAELYTAWKQDALAGSPVQSTKMEVDTTSPKRARGSSRERRTPESGGSQSSISCSSDGHSTDRGPAVLDRRESNLKPCKPMPVEPPMGAMRGRGGGKHKGGSKSRGKGRSKGRR
jgi:hypothetical protein